MTQRRGSGSQAELPDEEMEVRGGGPAFEDRRTVKEHDYESDEDEKAAKRHQSSQASPRHASAEPKVLSKIPGIPDPLRVH